MLKEKIAFIGAGRLAWSLIPALQSAGMDVVQLISRSEENRQAFAEAYGIQKLSSKSSELLEGVDWVILSVSDDAIAEVAKSLAGKLAAKTILIHTSGTTPLSVLENVHSQVGIFYPMQTFSRAEARDFSRIPLFVEGKNNTEKKIFDLAKILSKNTYKLDSEGRVKLHLGAVMVCNFTNLLYRLAEDQLAESGIETYKELIYGHLENVFAQGPHHTQTGPAVRGDQKVVDRHLELLEDNPKIQELYRLMSEIILEVRG